MGSDLQACGDTWLRRKNMVRFVGQDEDGEV